MNGINELFETVYVDDARFPSGSVYDKPYQPGSGKVRHILGQYEAFLHYVKDDAIHAYLRVSFDSGEVGMAIIGIANPGPIDVILRKRP